MQIELFKTEDGSYTLFSKEFSETYHSKHGAIQESMHIFIEKGLHHQLKTDINVLEIGFGTGLNAYLTLLETFKKPLNINFHTIEKYPIEIQTAQKLDYASDSEDLKKLFLKLHECNWNENQNITNNFSITKILGDIETQDYILDYYDVVYFDAFSPETQHQLWRKEVLQKVYNSMKLGGVLTTYCAKGEFRRTLQSIGFTVERLEGPPGKREMIRATKNLLINMSSM